MQRDGTLHKQCVLVCEVDLPKELQAKADIREVLRLAPRRFLKLLPVGHPQIQKLALHLLNHPNPVKVQQGWLNDKRDQLHQEQTLISLPSIVSYPSLN